MLFADIAAMPPPLFFFLRCFRRHADACHAFSLMMLLLSFHYHYFIDYDAAALFYFLHEIYFQPLFLLRHYADIAISMPFFADIDFHYCCFFHCWFAFRRRAMPLISLMIRRYACAATMLLFTALFAAFSSLFFSHDAAITPFSSLLMPGASRADFAARHAYARCR